MDVRLPRLGEGADSGTVSTLFVKEGDTVKKDQPILELESEKAVATIPSPSSGTVARLHVREGDLIKVGQVIVSLTEDGKGATAARHTVETVAEPEEIPAPEPVREVPEEPQSELEMPPAAGTVPGIPPPASPSLRRLARELGIDLRVVQGSERGGRIILGDLRRYIQRLQRLAARGQAAPGRPAAAPAPESFDFARWGPITTQRMSTLRRTISARMLDSWTTTPRVTQFDEADVTDVLSLRKKYASKYEKRQAHLTLTAFLIGAAVTALKKYPIVNASIDAAAGEVVFRNSYHIGIAVDTEQGLIVPVLRNADKKTLLEISTELRQLAERARERKLSLEEMQGGTFTISNQGGIGGAHFTPIINKPESAILGVGKGVVKPVVRNGRIAQRTMIPLGLSYDHRLIDGADAARFIVEFVRALEQFKESEVKL